MEAATIVKRIRATDGLTRTDLARLADVSPSTVSRIENGSLEPTWSTLQKLLSAAGMVINGTTVVSAGDPTAVTAARALLEKNPDAAPSEWVKRWERTGWAKLQSAEDVLALAITAGVAGQFARRARKPLYVRMRDQSKWQQLPAALSEAGIEYAISGLVATSGDRTTTTASAPIVYVRDPRAVARELDLVEVPPLQGTMLVPPAANELEGAEEEDGLWFVTRAQAMLDAFASGGRQPDKAESVAMSWPVAL